MYSWHTGATAPIQTNYINACMKNKTFEGSKTSSIVLGAKASDSKFCHRTGISRSGGRGESLRNKLCLAGALPLSLRIPPFKRFGQKILSYEILAFLPSTYNYPNNERKNGYQSLNASSVEGCSAKPQLCRAKRGTQ